MCQTQRRLQETARRSTSTIWVDKASRRTGNTLKAREDEQGIARHSGQPELVDEEHCALHPPDGRSEQFDENAQVDVTMQAAKCSIEPLSILAPESNVAVRGEKSEVAVKESREYILLSFQMTLRETQEITQTDVEVQGSGAGRCVDGRKRSIPF